MPHKKTDPPPGQASFLEVSVPTAPCVPAIREAVRQWVTSGYPGATQTTLTLLTYWFHTDHRLPDGSKFAYFPFQQEAIETLVYLYEVVKICRHKPLLETYARLPNLRLLQYDLFPRYCLKMATGSGKTKVMSLAIAWQYFNSILENRQDYAPTILLIAPNIIVFERLQLDFASGLVFRKDPVIPPELQIYWDFECYLRGESERASSSGALYLTNIQQLYESHTEDAAPEPDIMTLMLGPKPPTQPAGVEPFFDRILKRAGPTFVVNDEAHHTHDEESEWNRSIRRLHQLLVDAGSPGILQLDLTATPRYSKGSLFT